MSVVLDPHKPDDAAVLVRRARLTGHLAVRLRIVRPEAWGATADSVRSAVARRLAFTKWRLNRFGMLRDRAERRS